MEVAQVEAEAARRREEARARERLVAEDQHKRTRRRAAALSGEEQGHEQENRGIPTRGRRRAILEAAERLIQHQAHSFNVSVSLGGHVVRRDRDSVIGERPSDLDSCGATFSVACLKNL